MARRETRRARRTWLFKTEPTSFSFDDLLAAPLARTHWDGVRNHQARNLLRDEVKRGDLVFVYHSSAEPTGIAGLARVVGESTADPTQFDPRDEHFDPKSTPTAPTWVQVEIEALARLPRFVELAALKREPRLARMRVVQRGSRLSIQPVDPAEARVVFALAGLQDGDF